MKKNMECPNCSDQLKQHLHNSQPVDICDSCGGIWFDPGELQDSINYLLKHRPSEIPHSKPDLHRQRVAPSNAFELKKKCPKCNEGMQKINYMYDSNIILDKCNVCGGLWTDCGEFKKIAIHSKGNPLLDSLGRSVLKTGTPINQGKVEKIDPVVEVGKTLSRPAGLYLFAPRIIIPLRDDLPTNIIPYGTIGIILINIAIFALFHSLIGSHQDFYREYGLIPSEILSGTGFFPFISSIFIHDGFFHLLGNMFFLWIFADNVEEHLGLGEFIAFFFICGFWADILHILVNTKSTIPTIGSSGAIAGIMGAYFYLFPKAKIKTMVFYQVLDVPAFIYIGIWIFLQFIHAFFSLGLNTSVAFIAHIGGFFSGTFFIWLYENKIKPVALMD